MFKKILNYLFVIVLLYTTSSFPIYGQTENVWLKGLIVDSVNNPLPSASIIVELKNNERNIIFDKTNADGKFQIALPKHTNVTMTVSYLGLKKQTHEIRTKEEDRVMKIVLQGNLNIEEVVVNYKYQPIIIKKDTIIFDAQRFTSSTDRKLQDILKKLPGVTLHKGQVQFQGNAVTTTRVENKPFFGGNTRLAIENIPAEAISKIAIISHFSEIDFMKDVIASEDLAMNITLNDSHKNLLFGDLEATAGAKESFNVNSSLFSYTPQRNMQAIANWNNTGNAIFSLNDFVQLQGGLKNWNSKIQSANPALNDLFSSNRTHRAITQQVAATSFQRDWNNRFDLSIFAIYSRMNCEDYSLAELEYLLLEDKPSERRKTTNTPRTLNTWLNSRLKFKPSNFEVFDYQMSLQIGRQKQNMQYSSVWMDELNESKIKNTQTPLIYHQMISWNKKLSTQSIVESKASYTYQREITHRTMGSNLFHFPEIFPSFKLDYYDFTENKRLTGNEANYLAQFFYQFNRFHQISPVIKAHYNSLSINDVIFIENENGQLQNISSYGFGNKLTYQQFDMLFGIQYKIEWNNLVIKILSGASYVKHQVKQSYGKNQKTSFIFNPKINLDYKFSEFNRIAFVYEKSYSYPNVRFIDTGYELVSFNSIYRGAANLSTERFQVYSINFRKFAFNSKNYWAFLNYTKKSQTYRNEAVINSKGQLSQSNIMKTPESTISLALRAEYPWKTFTTSISLSTNLSSYHQILNGIYFNTEQYGFKPKVAIRTLAKEFPELRMSYEYSLSRFNGQTKSTFLGHTFETGIRYTILERWKIQSEYFYYHSRNIQINSKQKYNNLNAKVSYQLKANAWGISLDMLNMLGNKSTIILSQSDFYAIQTEIASLPRQILIGFNYKL